MATLCQTVAAWRHALEALLRLGQALPAPAWAAPTECPKWTVKDIYAHLIGGELWMAAGHPPPEQAFPQWAAEPVDARRDTPPHQVLAELREVFELRALQLSRAAPDPAQPAYLPTGAPVTLRHLLRVRVMDVWTHEQDVRRAVDRPGNLASPGAAIAGDLFVSALPRIVARAAQAPPGAVVRLSTRGEVELDVAVSVGQDGRGSLVAPPRCATCHLTLGWEAYTRLSCGRGERPDQEIRVTGDRALAHRVLTHLAITP